MVNPDDCQCSGWTCCDTPTIAYWPNWLDDRSVTLEEKALQPKGHHPNCEHYEFPPLLKRALSWALAHKDALEKLNLEKADLIQLTDDGQCICGKCFDALAFKPVTDAKVQSDAKALVVAAYAKPVGEQRYPKCARGMLDRSPCPGFYAGVTATIRALKRSGYPFDMGRSRAIKLVPVVEVEEEESGDE